MKPLGNSGKAASPAGAQSAEGVHRLAPAVALPLSTGSSAQRSAIAAGGATGGREPHCALRGVLPATITPLDAGGRLRPSALERLMERSYAAGCDGVYVCGQTGEGALLSLADRRRVAEIAVRNSPRGKQVIIHVGASRTADAIALARQASRVGAHAISSLPPLGPFSFAEVRGYYEALSAASDVPLLVYFCPEVSGSIDTVEHIMDLCSIPNVVGLKFTDFNLYQLSVISRAGPAVFTGRDDMFVAGILMGASGGIGCFYNLVPELFVEIRNRADLGDWSGARRVQDRINDLIRAVVRYPMLGAVKTLLEWSGIEAGFPAPPRRPLSKDEQVGLRAEVLAAGFEPDQFLARVADVRA